MGKLQQFVILYDHPKGVYRAGDVVKGQVIVELSQPMNMKNIRLLCQGRAKVHWTKTKRHGKGSHTVHYRADEVYFETLMPIYGTEHGESTLDAGKHHFDFNISLNENLPSSFEGTYGYVRYACKATIDKPWKFDYDTKAAFTVISNLDLNREPVELKTAMQGDERSEVSCCCCLSGDVHALFRINKRGFVPGECIRVYAKVQNRSNSTVVSTRVSIKQYTEFYGKSDTLFSSGSLKPKSESSYITTKERGAIPAGETDIWDNIPVQIPAIPPSRLVGCDIINISYVIKFYVAVSYGDEIKLASDIIIGTIPLVESFVELNREPRGGITRQPSAPSSDGAGNYPGLSYEIDEDGWQIPPPSYEEHFNGKVHIKEEEDTDYTHGDMHWAPSYPFYRQLSLETQLDDNVDENKL